MSDDEIDLERVVSDPAYRREVIDYLKSVDGAADGTSERVAQPQGQPRP